MDAKEEVLAQLDCEIRECLNSDSPSVRLLADGFEKARRVVQSLHMSSPQPKPVSDEPAFPARMPTLHDGAFRTGVTTREYFAAHAPIDYETACAIFGEGAPLGDDR
jgi:hypothetical protein